jgi:hypothetical protein
LIRLLALLCTALLTSMAPARAGDAPAVPRIEARSENLLAVGIVKGDRMSIHISRVADNSPVRDAVLAVMLRGVVHPTVAEPDGSYTLQTEDLKLPGAASVALQVVQGPVREDLKAELVVAAESQPDNKGGTRQLWWWVLNFAVCIGFLKLLATRRKAAAEREKRAGE